MEGKNIYDGTAKNDVHFIIRYPTELDAVKMLEYINTLSHEKTFIRFQGEDVYLKDETEFLQKQLDKIKSNQAVLLLVFSGETLIGISGIDMKDKISQHEGVFGISIAKDFRGAGIGQKLMEITIREAEINIHTLKIITLGVFSNNPTAIKMYQNFGFKEFGNLPKGIIYKGNYVDHMYMYKKIGEF